jgi:hypothetical protein
MIASHSRLNARALILCFGAMLALAASSCTNAEPAPDRVQGSQAKPSDQCAEAASVEDLVGDARQRSIADCRAGKTYGVQGEAGRERLKACLDEADEERLYSLGRDEFMTKCLKGE